ncbi:MAG: RIP metalloprotease RseP [Alphaproteobacteria bacterium]|nr:RIP metalloprotease RseP [Alphaproteobacteria bacterium]
MESIFNSFYYIVPFIFLLGVLVFVHEFGHFIIARMCGVRVTDFSIGFGRKLWGFTDKYQTNWKICAIPLGGYCQFLGDANGASAGEDAETLESLSEDEKKHSFAYQNPWKKLAIVLGGPGFNYLFAIIVMSLIFMFVGMVNYPPIVGEVIPGSAAEQAGLQEEDVIIEVNGHQIEAFSDISSEVALSADGIAKIVLLRGDETISLDVKLTNISIEEGDPVSERPMLGIKSKTSIDIDGQKLSFFPAIAEACRGTWRMTTDTLRGVGQMITGKRSGEDLGGIIRIAEMTGDISKKSGWVDFVAFMAILSINLGLINLFPIPVLDGGHVVIFLLEIISGREMHEKVKEVLFKCGFALLLALMLFATWNDFVHLFKRWFV